MAGDYNADNACPLVTGISLRIVAEASYEEYKLGIKQKTLLHFGELLTLDQNWQANLLAVWIS